jgi:hypothetical protein
MQLEPVRDLAPADPAGGELMRLRLARIVVAMSGVMSIVM